MGKINTIDIITTLIITIFGLINNEITIFYIVFLFWFQELIRTIVDIFFIFKNRKIKEQLQILISQLFSSFFLLFVYLVFIVVVFGFFFAFKNKIHLSQNFSIILFNNYYFNLNIIFFLIQYAYYRSTTDNSKLELKVFNRRHIILHLSIILGGVLNMLTNYIETIPENIKLVILITPFLLLKVFLMRNEHQKSTNF